MRRIQAGDGNNLYNLIAPWIQGVCLWGDRSAKELWVIVEYEEPENKDDLIRRVDDMQLLILQCVNLIQLLKDRYLIFTYQTNRTRENEVTVGQVPLGHRIQHRISDATVAELFLAYAGTDVIVTPELQKFICDGFITREEVRGNRQFRIALVAIGIAIAALCWNIWSSRHPCADSANPHHHYRHER